MLKEISCDRFADGKKIIQFHQGLNVVLGDDEASNSIGKSTFLMIIDFVFGGSDYVEKCLDVQEEIKIHTINFKFVFEDVPFYFSRSTGDTTIINICNENYQTEKTITKDKYMAFLQEKYGLDLPELTFRNAISRFIRVYGRETLDERYPLRQATREKDKAGIDGMLKLFGLYEAVAEKTKLYETAKDEEDTFKKAQKYKYIRVVSNQKEYKKNEENIGNLELKIKEIALKSSGGLLDLDSVKAQRLAELKRALSQYNRQKTKLEAQLKSAEDDKNFSKHSFQKDYDKLLQFFPVANVEKLEEIESFHKKLKGVLDKEFKETADNLQSMIDLVSIQIQELQEQLISLGNTPNVSQAVLDQYYIAKKELQALKEANENFDKKKAYKDRTETLKGELDALVLSVINQLQLDINAKMKELNDYIYDGAKTPPILTFTDAAHYDFFTPKDSGTGSRYKGLVVFDLAALEHSDLPLVVHDSVLLKQIGKKPLEKILELYNRADKQVFIAFDMKTAYSDRIQELVEGNKVLGLSASSGALFGKTWNENIN